MSVPVLNWLSIAPKKYPHTVDHCWPTDKDTPILFHRPVPSICYFSHPYKQGLHLTLSQFFHDAIQTLNAQPLEPCLFPRLRHNFADFPYLRSSIDQRLQTLETCCGYEYDLTRKSLAPPVFQGMATTHQTPRIVGCFSDFPTLSRHDVIPRLFTIDSTSTTNNNYKAV